MSTYVTINKLLVNKRVKVPVGNLLALISNNIDNKENIMMKNRIAEKVLEKKPVSKEANRMQITPIMKEIAQENDIEQEEMVNQVIHSNDAIRSAIAATMSKSNCELPPYYLEKNIEMSKALAWLQETNNQLPIKKRIIPVTILIKAVAKCLIDFPELNAIWDNGLKLTNEVNIEVDISLRAGEKVVPTIHQVDSKTVLEIMEILSKIIPRTRGLRLRSSELSGSTITITNLGEIGADKVFGNNYLPQVAIIGFGNIIDQYYVENGMIGTRPIINVTLGGDHRVTDGHTGNNFLSVLNKYLQNPSEL